MRRVRWQLALRWVPIGWGERDAPEQRRCDREFDAYFSWRGLAFADEHYRSEDLLLRRRIHEEKFVQARHGAFQAKQASVGAYRGSVGEFVEGVLSCSARDADGHGDLHSLRASLGGVA